MSKTITAGTWAATADGRSSKNLAKFSAIHGADLLYASQWAAAYADWLPRANQVAYVAIDPKTGCHLRQATQLEADHFLAQPLARRNALRVGDVLITDYHGEGGYGWDQGVSS